MMANRFWADIVVAGAALLIGLVAAVGVGWGLVFGPEIAAQPTTSTLSIDFSGFGRLPQVEVTAPSVPSLRPVATSLASQPLSGTSTASTVATTTEGPTEPPPTTFTLVPTTTVPTPATSTVPETTRTTEEATTAPPTTESTTTTRSGIRPTTTHDTSPSTAPTSVVIP